jgi:hypothetical protein
MEVSPADVKLQRYNGTAWQVLPTTIDGDTTVYSVFEADTSGFSPFAITAERPLPSIPNNDVEVLTTSVADVGLEKIQPKKSGIWTIIIAFILAGVLAVGYEYLKKE